jgi:polysaccharide biosynthesis protein PslJ
MGTPDPPGVGARHRTSPVAHPVGVLTLLVGLLIGIPSQLVFAPLGAAGSPAQLLGVGLLAWWILLRITERFPRAGPDYAVRVACVVLLASILVSYVAATIRPIDGAELRAADRGLLSTLAWLGVLLFAMDAVATREQLTTLLRRLCLAGTLLALLGLVQFLTRSTLIDAISIPGLTANQEIGVISERSGFARPAGTAIHPIEFGAVLTLIFPLTLHFGLLDSRRRGPRAWLPAVVIGAMLLISLSRSALLAAFVALLIVLPSWPGAARRRMYAAGGAILVIIYLTIPGMLGTTLQLFTGVRNDASTLSRTNSYDLAWEFIRQAPLFGRGLRTFLPSYRILDNQYLIALIEIGIVGTVALAALFAASVRTTWRARASDLGDRSLARSLVASIFACAVSFATFDAFSFPMVPTLLFLLIGCAGAFVTVTSRHDRAGSSGPTTGNGRS